MTSEIKTLTHDLEIAFCGYSGSGKTTLVTKVIEVLSRDYSVGYLKHDAHKFSMDKEGKDTFKARNAGAKCVHINSTESSATLRDDSYSEFYLNDIFIDNDFVLIEGYKKSTTYKVLVLGEGQSSRTLLEEYRAGEYSNVLAIIGRGTQSEEFNVPYFNANDVEGVSNFVLNHFKKLISKRPLYGLVLAGGRSSRMGADKGKLKYRDVSQTEYLVKTLEAHCEKVFVSCREDQRDEEHIAKFDFIEDQIINIGPIGGILSAMLKFRNARWLVMACDLPFIDTATVEQLVSESDPFKVATSFINPEKLWAEPLCTIYEPKAYAKLFKVLGIGKMCPRKVLLNSNIKTLKPINSKSLDNANTPQDYERVNKMIEELG